MRRWKWIPILFLAAAIATGCGNSVKDLKFSEQGTDNNWRSVFKSAVMSDALSQEEKTLLQDAIMREKQNIPRPSREKQCARSSKIRGSGKRRIQ